MRILVAAAAAIVMLGSASANAQSLEQTYADLCSDPAKAKSESCVALAQALVAKLQGQGGASSAAPTSKSAGPDAATLAVWRKRWGVLLDTVDKEMFVVAGPEATADVKLAVLGLGYRGKATWKVPGEELVNTMVMADGTVQEVGVARWDELNQRIATTTNGATATTYSFTQPDGSVITEVPAPSGAIRVRFYRLPNGRIQTFSQKLEAGVWVAIPQGNAQYVEYSPERLAHERELIQLAEQQRVQDQLRAGQEERAAKAERSAARGAMFGAVLQGLAQGAAESNTGGYAEAQANLDATVANINAAAAMERQQQALAAQQEQARAAEQQRQQLAENARWVAEKEQAAAEYRSGQVEAAAAREAQLVAQQQAHAQQRVAAEAQRRSVEQAATVQRQQAQSAALAERKPVTAQPVAQRTEPGASTNHAPQAPSGQTASGGSSQLYVFFIVLGGQTVAFEGPLVLTLAESEAMEARLSNEAPSKYGAGATVDRRWRGPGTCLFVYQIPGEPLYKLGSGNGSVDTERSKNGQVSNGKATIHRDVVCPRNN